MKGDPLGALRPDARQLAELVDQILDGSLEQKVTSPADPCRPSRRPADRAGLRQDGDLLGGVGDRTDDQILQGLDIGGIDDLRVDRHADHLTAATHGDLDQPAAGLAVHLGVGQRLLSLHQLLLHLLRLREQR